MVVKAKVSSVMRDLDSSDDGGRRRQRQHGSCHLMHSVSHLHDSTAVSSEAWAKLRDWASVVGRGRLLLSGSVAHASLKTAVQIPLFHEGYM